MRFALLEYYVLFDDREIFLFPLNLFFDLFGKEALPINKACRNYCSSPLFRFLLR